MNLAIKQRILKTAKRFSLHSAPIYVFDKLKLGLYVDRIIKASVKYEREVMARLCEVRAQEMRGGLMRLEWDSVAYRQRVGIAMAMEGLAQNIRDREWDQETADEIREHMIDIRIQK